MPRKIKSPLARVPASAVKAPAVKVPGAPHIIVAALAGTGKTTTLVSGLQVLKGLPPTDARGRPITPSPQQAAIWEALVRGPAPATVGFCAFNKSIASELQARVPPGCDAMTLHSLGYRAVLKAFPGTKVNSYRTQDIIAELLETDIRDLRRKKPTLVSGTEKLVGLCKQNLLAGTEDELAELADRHDVDLNGSRTEVYALVPRVLERAKDIGADRAVGFDDMVWAPIALDLPVSRYDLLLVDEAQDLNRCQQALARKAGTRLVLVGDAHQAIYGFAGADSDSLPRMTAELEASSVGCIVLPLNVTRRCGQAIVQEAQKYVPGFEAHENNPDGQVGRAAFRADGANDYRKQAADGDFLLCRCNAPLVSECFRFLAAGRKATIQGRDIGAGLIALVKKLEAGTIPELIQALGTWSDREREKELAKKNPSDNKLQSIEDKADCLLAFAGRALSVAGVIADIERVFTDDKNAPGLRLSSIHRAKGLESRRVFLLQGDGERTFGPPLKKLQAWERQQERNLQYVAITRAIEVLTYVA